mmetsp:Transcript_69158/g.191383  ORF Transcript_69158/g.191383 Transcript_69158/m.191383 type:complete len:247 (+) Transcript_69158:84-824(+)
MQRGSCASGGSKSESCRLTLLTEVCSAAGKVGFDVRSSWVDPHSNTQSGSSRPSPTMSFWQLRSTRPLSAGRSRTNLLTPRATALATARSSREVNSSKMIVPRRPDAHSAKPQASVALSRSPPERIFIGRNAVPRSSDAADSAGTASVSERKCAKAGAASSQSMVRVFPKCSRASVVLPVPEGPRMRPIEKSCKRSLNSVSAGLHKHPSEPGSLGTTCTHKPSKPSSRYLAACPNTGDSQPSSSPT